MPDETPSTGKEKTAKLRHAWHKAKSRTHRHRLIVMAGTIAALWTILLLHLAGVISLSAGAGFLAALIRPKHPAFRLAFDVLAVIVMVFLLIEWRGILNTLAHSRKPIAHIEKKRIYLPSRRQALTAILLTISLLLFIWQSLGAGAFDLPRARTDVPGSAPPIYRRVVAPPRRPWAAGSGVVRLPSTLRREISNYSYIERRQFQIAADPAGLSIAGKVYSDEGVTPLTGVTVAVSLNGGAAAGTDAVDGGGMYLIPDLTMTGGTIVTLYIDGHASNKAVTVTLGSGLAMTGVHLYQNHLIVRSDSGSVALTNAHLNIADNNADADIKAVYGVDSANTLQVAADKELYVWPGDSFSPGGRVKTHDLEVKGTMTMGTNGLTVSGSLVANAGTFTTSTGVLLSSRDDDETFNPGSNIFQNLDINNGLVGYWKLDEGSGNKAMDSSGYGNHGTLTTMSTGIAGPGMASGWTGSSLSTAIDFYNPYALKFDGTDDYVLVTDAINGDPLSNPFSVMVWFKADLLDGTKGILQLAETLNDTGPSIIIQHNSTCLRIYVNNAYSGCFTITTDTWYQAIYTFDGTTANIYVNGAFSSSVNKSGNPGDNNLYIGNGYSGYFDGIIDDVRIYNRALSNSEIATLYAGRKSTGSGQYTLGSNLDINGNLNLISGGITTAGNNINVAGNVSIQGDLTQAAGTFTLDGANNQTISGSTVFHNFTKTVSSPATLFIDHTSRISASGALRLEGGGTTSTRLTLRSTRSGSASNLLLDSSGVQNIAYVDVKDNDASGGQTLICLTAAEGCLDSGNTTNWNFGSGAGLLPPPIATNYKISPDSLNSGGLDYSKSNDYLLSDTLGETFIGHASGTNYTLESGYRQPSNETIFTMNCSAGVDLGTVTYGVLTGSGTCTVYTDSPSGYSLSWAVMTGSGGYNTGSLINRLESTIPAYTPAQDNTPETWSVGVSDAEWGGRLRSTSTDTAAEWGTDGVNDKWLNIRAESSRTIVTRSSATDPAGSEQIIQFRAEVGNTASVQSGNYEATVTITAVGL